MRTLWEGRRSELHFDRRVFGLGIEVALDPKLHHLVWIILGPFELIIGRRR